jgi:uncharacterized protein YbjT (DUF2867 family)
MPMKAAIAGATGFIGSQLLGLMKDDAAIESVQVLSRRPLDLPSKFTVIQSDLMQPRLTGPVDTAFCALGTTMAVAGSKEAFYHVDHDLVLAFAQAAKAQGAQTFILVSSIGADARSSNYYLKVKGQTEEDLKALGFRSLIILQPSLLMGDRREFRLGERVGQGAMTLLGPLMLGPLAKYRGIHGRTVANAMLRLAKEDLPGVHVLESDRLQAFH